MNLLCLKDMISLLVLDYIFSGW